MNEQMFDNDLCADDPLPAAAGRATMKLRAMARQGDHLRQFFGNLS